MNMEERLQTVVSQAETDGQKWHTIIHGDDKTTVPTDNGNVPTVAKQLRDVREAITGGVLDVVAKSELARDTAVAAKNETINLKNATDQIKTETQAIKEATQEIKASADAVFNNISTTTNSSIQTIQTETASQIALVKSTGSSQVSSVQAAGATQIADVNTEGQKQIALATAQANQARYYSESCAPTPLGSRLCVPANTKVPDGYEPVWYKNTITRARYPDFFTQLVDTNSLIFVDEATYDSQVDTYGMCASYVKVDNDTLILPLLLNFGRGGTTSQLGGVELDQFQGHYHACQVRIDAYGSGDGATMAYTNGTDEGMKDGTPDLMIYDPTTGANGTVRYGNETRPKGYYELNYIKCADISRPLSEENTTEIRNIVVNKVDTNLENITATALFNKTGSYSKSSTSFWEQNKATGLIFQGGRVNITTSADFSVTFPKAFSSTVISIVVTPYGQATNSTSDTNYCAMVIGVSTTAFTIRYVDSDSTNRRQGYVAWFAIGY